MASCGGPRLYGGFDHRISEVHVLHEWKQESALEARAGRRTRTGIRRVQKGPCVIGVCVLRLSWALYSR